MASSLHLGAISAYFHSPTPTSYRTFLCFCNYRMHIAAAAAGAGAGASGPLRCSPSPVPGYLPRASAEDMPTELLEDSKFAPINNDDPQFGPPAMLLMGFTYAEALKVQELLQNMEGNFLKVLLCTSEMVSGTLWEAMNKSQSDLKNVKVAQDVPRICFLSGLTGEEIMMLVRVFPDAKLEPTVYAALVPNNAQKTVEELMEEIMGDHERLARKTE